MGMMDRFHLRERIDVISKWLQMGSCLNAGTMMGGYYPPELMQHFLDAIKEYEIAVERLREKTGKPAKSG